MKTKLIPSVIALSLLLVGIAVFWPKPPPPNAEPPQPPPASPELAAEPVPPPGPIEPVAPPPPAPTAASESSVPQPPTEPPSAPVAKNERLARLHETFRALAAGDPRTALRAARELTDDVERETALLTLVTEWKQGELTPPRQRAWAIASFGLEAGLATELAGNPELAQLWASELTNAQGRAVSPERLGPAMIEADPATALAYAAQFNTADRRKFLTSAFSTWATKDTEAALQWVEQVSDPTERDLALQAVRSVAPTGIGVELATQDGSPVIQRMFPGTPAELSGQLHPGDRILALAQGNNVFVDTRDLSMQELVQSIRGTPGTMVQLRVLPADAAPGATPKTIALVRGQIKFKR